MISIQDFIDYFFHDSSGIDRRDKILNIVFFYAGYRC